MYTEKGALLLRIWSRCRITLLPQQKLLLLLQLACDLHNPWSVDYLFDYTSNAYHAEGRKHYIVVLQVSKVLLA